MDMPFVGGGHHRFPGRLWLAFAGAFSGGGMLVLCFLMMVAGATLGMEASFRSLKFLAPVNAVITPLVLMGTFVILLNESLRGSVSPTPVKWLLGVVLFMNSLVLLIMLFSTFSSKVAALMPGSGDTLDNFQLGILEQIDNCDASKDITSLFIFSGDNQPRQIREKARLKIRSKPDWQDDLYNTLEGDDVDEAFLFLLSNEIDDRPKFAKGVYQGILSQARLIRERLRRSSHPSHVYEGQFIFEVERSLQVAEKFKDLGVDFKPAVKELRAALDEPIAYENPNNSCKRSWING
ncbi:MAG: hypothetical protein IPN29_02875 [Saprospiraceae bacterium]|nr:hypothetical protein [Saprospiraceae bacterium]